MMINKNVQRIAQSFISVVLPILSPLFFIACGNESGTEAATSIKSEVETSFELGKCTHELEGVSTRVTQENTYYVCMNEKWTLVGTTETGTQSSSSSVFVAYTISSNSNNNTTGFFTDSRDMQTYKIVTIGNQTWMARDLNYETDNSYSYDNRYCFSEARCNRHGRVYTWAMAMDSAGIWSVNGKGCGSSSTCAALDPIRGICPDGWHIPTKDEFQRLINFVGGEGKGRDLKSADGWYENHDTYHEGNYYYKGNGTDTYGFSASPSFAIYANGSNRGEGRAAVFWSTTAYGNDSVYAMFMSADNNTVVTGIQSKKCMFAVRCIQNSSYSSSSFSNTIVSSSSENSLIVDSRDNHSYKIVTIGTQIWMAQNLSYETDNSECFTGLTGCKYTWGTAMDSAGIWSTNGKGCGAVPMCSPTYPVRGVCPSGWHLPTKNEFEKMFTTVGGADIAGTKLKSRYCWNKSGNGTDDYGFDARPENCPDGNWIDFWTSTEESVWNVYMMTLWYSYDWAELGTVSNNQRFYYFVRCVKD